MTKPLLLELLTHMEWADGKVLQAAAGTGDTPPDEYLLKTLLHIHFTQFAFLGAWQGDRIDWSPMKSLTTIKDLGDWAAPHYPAIQQHVANAEDLDRAMILPWADHFAKKDLAREKAESTSLGETAYQMVAHSQYHRAQANRRIRELGGEPPAVDYIIWVWAGRPAT